MEISEGDGTRDFLGSLSQELRVSIDASDVKTQRFEIKCEGKTSYLAYEIDPQGCLVLWHTEVPATQRGRGLAGRLVRMALRYAEERGLKVEVICPFAIGYISRNPDLQHLVSKRANGIR
jgi:predicted GNAT family acetyltransferase